MNDDYTKIWAKIQDADAIIIGASNGLSISEGYHIFAEDKNFLNNFGEFREHHGIRSIIQGCFHTYPSEEEKWAFFSRIYDYFLYKIEASAVMKNLYELMENKNYFVVTSNIDDHFHQAGFLKSRLWEIEGNCRNLQCSESCHDKLYSGDNILSKMAQTQKNGKISEDLVPKCPKCGGNMKVHLEVDGTFLRGEDWQESYHSFQNFIEQSHNKKIVLLELGVGIRNQLIKAPFMRLTNLENNATYISLNKGELYIPKSIAEKSIGIDGDIAEVLENLIKNKQGYVG